jgi:hypothetical protein
MTVLLAEIMTSPSFGEVMFLVAVILFVIALVGELMSVLTHPPATWAYGRLIAFAGLACVAMGWLALVTGD